MKATLKPFILIFILCLFYTCSNKKNNQEQEASTDEKEYAKRLLPVGAEPWAIYYNGKYYYTQGEGDKIILRRISDINKLISAKEKTVWIPKEESNAHHLWAPEIHRINDKWYIYFPADDGNMDNHQIYVIENSSEDPFKGEFEMKGRIQTDKDNNWAIHASVFEHKDEWYMIWSGWQTRRIETETQCIYIAKMKNPWTLASDRVLISAPEYEWERQWINPDGSKTSYPIYVNEAPQYFHTKNKDKVLIYYSASGNWSPYYAVGLLWADADSDLLDPASWNKSETPIFMQNAQDSVFAPGSLSFVPSIDGKDTYFIYHARSIPNEPLGALDSRSPRMQKLEWDENGFPILGKPLPIKKP